VVAGICFATVFWLLLHCRLVVHSANNMEHSKEYYQSFVTFLQDACDKQRRDYPYEDGCAIAGDYWMAVCKHLKEQKLARLNYGDLHIFQFPPLLPIIADCKAAISAIERAEHDRDLANREKIENITYGKKGYKISKVAIWLSATAILVEIARGILEILL